MAAMDRIGAFAMTEPLGGSDVAGGMRTTTRREGDTWVLNGAKKWIGNATFADYVVVWARDVDDNHVKGFVVEKGTPGFAPVKIEGKIAFRIVENAEITLTDVRVPEANRLQNINSFRDVAEILRATRAGVAWQALGVMTGAYELALDYARERKQFGRPIGGFQLVQDLLVKSLGNITASWGMLVQLARLQDSRHLPRRTLLAGQGVRHLADAGGRRLEPRDLRRQRHPPRPRHPPLLRRRRGHLLLRGHARDEHPDRGQVDHRPERLRVTSSSRSAPGQWVPGRCQRGRAHCDV